MRILRSPAFWVILLSIGIAVCANVSDHNGFRSSATIADDRPSLSKMATQSTLLREGTALSELKGRFRKQGDRIVFVDDSNNRSFKCLENISLQRIDSAIQDEDRKLVWLVTAKVSEFNEENFLLVEKAVRAR